MCVGGGGGPGVRAHRVWHQKGWVDTRNCLAVLDLPVGVALACCFEHGWCWCFTRAETAGGRVGKTLMVKWLCVLGTD
jgi:hypothetical protein